MFRFPWSCQNCLNQNFKKVHNIALWFSIQWFSNLFLPLHYNFTCWKNLGHLSLSFPESGFCQFHFLCQLICSSTFCFLSFSSYSSWDLIFRVCFRVGRAGILNRWWCVLLVGVMEYLNTFLWFLAPINSHCLDSLSRFT